MAAAIADTPPQQLLRAHISKYDVTQTIDTVETLYFEALARAAAKSDRVSESMKILHVVPTYYPAVRYGGPIRSVHGLASALAAQGHDVHVYTTNVDGEGVLPVPLDRPVQLDGVNVWYFATSVGRRLYRSPRMRQALRVNIATSI